MLAQRAATRHEHKGPAGFPPPGRKSEVCPQQGSKGKNMGTKNRKEKPLALRIRKGRASLTQTEEGRKVKQPKKKKVK